MRTIGKRNIAKLKLIVQEEMSKGIPNLEDRVIARIPEEWLDIWESAHDEIHRIIFDTMMGG